MPRTRKRPDTQPEAPRQTGILCRHCEAVGHKVFVDARTGVCPTCKRTNGLLPGMVGTGIRGIGRERTLVI
jgi:hypothetical protein